MNETISRRDFIGSAVASSISIGAAGALCNVAFASEGSDASAATSSTTGSSAVDSTSASADATGSSAGLNGSHTWDVAPSPIENISDETDCDILIIGAGLSGMVCAMTSAEAGANVVVLEKNDTRSMRGSMIGGVGTTIQNDAGITFDKGAYMAAYVNECHGRFQAARLREWLDNSCWAIDDLFAHCENDGAEPFVLEMPGDFKSTMSSGFSATQDWRESQQLLGDALVKWGTAAGATYIFSTPAQQLVTDTSGKVIGAIATDSGGINHQYNASKAVVLACGDFSGNPEMVNAWSPMCASCINTYVPAGMNTGDGLCMGLWVGAALQKMEPAPMLHAVNIGNHNANGGGLYVNMLGERFVTEGTSWVIDATLTQPGGKAWHIIDSNFVKYKTDNGGRATEITDEDIDNEWAFKGDSIEELANTVGIDPVTLQSTITRYNELVDLGTDEDFGKSADNLAPKIETAPFYALTIPNNCLCIPYGLNVDANHQVCNADDKPIEGLYAIGNMGGNLFSVEYTEVAMGISHGRCVTDGYCLSKILNG